MDIGSGVRRDAIRRANAIIEVAHKLDHAITPNEEAAAIVELREALKKLEIITH